MSLTFEITGTLPEHAIRHIVREAESRMADGQDAKALLVTAAQHYLAEQHAHDIKTALDGALSTATMLGMTPDYAAALADVKAQIGAEFDTIVTETPTDDTNVMAFALAKAAVEFKRVLPPHRGRWLAKLGIVDAHVKAMTPATTAPAPETTIGDVPDENAALAAMLGLSGSAPEVPPPPPPFASVSAEAAAPLLPTMSAAAPSAAAPTPAADSGVPAPGQAPRDAWMIMNQALDMDDGALAKRLGVSRSTIHNYRTGRVAKVRMTIPQARMMVAEIDARCAQLRQAADIFAQIRE
jgi:hypothetical protein